MFLRLIVAVFGAPLLGLGIACLWQGAWMATGFGRMTMAEFGCSIKSLLSLDLCPLEEVVVCVLKSYEAAELRAALTVKP